MREGVDKLLQTGATPTCDFFTADAHGSLSATSVELQVRLCGLQNLEHWPGALEKGESAKLCSRVMSDIWERDDSSLDQGGRLKKFIQSAQLVVVFWK